MREFCDVSLVCGDGRSYPAHKVILSSHSQTLSSILAQFPASQFCLYLAGLDSRHLASLLTFIYCGEVSLSQEDLPAFLSAAHTLQVTGLQEHDQGVRGIQGLAGSSCTCALGPQGVACKFTGPLGPRTAGGCIHLQEEKLSGRRCIIFAHQERAPPRQNYPTHKDQKGC